MLFKKKPKRPIEPDILWVLKTYGRQGYTGIRRQIIHQFGYEPNLSQLWRGISGLRIDGSLTEFEAYGITVYQLNKTILS